ncbi:MAG: aldehyde ferredoxin oxidoreductase [Spirochaetales bacterium]|nr:MAG: aldehyde ferredoxin oxidoreductase [Spirochaetales bacterium]
MDTNLRVLTVDCENAFYRTSKYPIGPFFGPVDLGLHLSSRYRTLNFGAGLLAASIFPGSNRLVVTGYSPCWGGFYISSMGGAALVFDNLGINMLSLTGKAAVPSILYLNRVHGEEIEVSVVPVDVNRVWEQDPGGVYSMMQEALDLFGGRYLEDPRVLAIGPAGEETDFGGIGSGPIINKKMTPVDTWAGRGGLGTNMYRDHGITAIIYGGTFIDEDFRNRQVADQWFSDKYEKKVAAKDFEATTKYRFDPKFGTGGTFGVNYSTLKGRMMAFNYQTIYWDEESRLKVHADFIVDHYLKQFNEETIVPKQQKTCGEPCTAVCKKLNGEYKKDYEPYQTLGPQSGIFDQRAAEKLNRHADKNGFDAISLGGVLSWLMECLDKNYLSPEDLGVVMKPRFSPDGFDITTDSMLNAELGVQLIDSILYKRGIVNMEEGARKFARQLSRDRGPQVLNCFVYNAYGRRGWMVPNQYWTPGALSPMSIMGKYYMYYGNDFLPPRELGHMNAGRFLGELSLDNMGICRFHRAWAEEMLPEIMESLYGMRTAFLENLKITASRINSRNSSIFWESERNFDYIHTFLKRQKTVEGKQDPELDKWLNLFENDKKEASLSFWYEVHKGIHESLREF